MHRLPLNSHYLILKLINNFVKVKKYAFKILHYIAITYSQDQIWVLLNYDLYA